MLHCRACSFSSPTSGVSGRGRKLIRLRTFLVTWKSFLSALITCDAWLFFAGRRNIEANFLRVFCSILVLIRWLIDQDCLRIDVRASSVDMRGITCVSVKLVFASHSTEENGYFVGRNLWKLCKPVRPKQGQLYIEPPAGIYHCSGLSLSYRPPYQGDDRDTFNILTDKNILELTFYEMEITFVLNNGFIKFSIFIYFMFRVVVFVQV